MQSMLLTHLVQLLAKKSSSQGLFQVKQTSAYIVIMEDCLVRKLVVSLSLLSSLSL